MLQDREIYCLQARPCIFQPGNFTGWGSEGVNVLSCRLDMLGTVLLNRRTIFVLRTQKRGTGTGGGGGGGGGNERLDRGYRPKKTRETVDRRQNNGNVKAVSPRHCAATSALRRVTRTMSIALLLRNNSKRKKSNLRSPAPPPYS